MALQSKFLINSGFRSGGWTKNKLLTSLKTLLMFYRNQNLIEIMKKVITGSLRSCMKNKKNGLICAEKQRYIKC